MVYNLSVLEIIPDGPDTVVVVKAGSLSDRYFPPMLAAQVFLDVRGLIHQDCDSLPVQPVGCGAKEGTTQVSRRWAFAQEIFSNNGRGTESGHFLEHLVLQLATNRLNATGDPRPLAGDTCWNWSEEPDLFRIRFFDVGSGPIKEALVESQELLARCSYRVDVGPASEAAQAA